VISRDEVEALLSDFIGGLEFSLDEDASLPLYHQLSRVLVRFIRAGNLQPKDAFPSEETVASAFGVSRPTANKAIEELVLMGWLVRKTGRGSFVRRAPGQVLTYMSPRLTLSDLVQPDSELVSAVIERRIEAAGEDTAQLLDLELEAPVIFIRRLFSFRGSPVLVVDSRLDERRFPGLVGNPLAAESVLAALREQYHCNIRYSEWGVEATEVLERDLAKLLGIPSYTPILLMAGVRYADHGEPIEDYRAYVNQGVRVRATTHHE
jgi:GntR family transcriptional regulator